MHHRWVVSYVWYNLTFSPTGEARITLERNVDEVLATSWRNKHVWSWGRSDPNKESWESHDRQNKVLISSQSSHTPQLGRQNRREETNCILFIELQPIKSYFQAGTIVRESMMSHREKMKGDLYAIDRWRSEIVFCGSKLISVIAWINMIKIMVYGNACAETVVRIYIPNLHSVVLRKVQQN